MLIPINTAKLYIHACKAERTIGSKLKAGNTDKLIMVSDSAQEKRSNDQANYKLNKKLSDDKYFRANLLNQIVNKMSGLEAVTIRGQYVEYFA
ncbi:MAG: hypothetical protein AAF419_03495 [Pseudomonadota bacterium]